MRQLANCTEPWHYHYCVPIGGFMIRLMRSSEVIRHVWVMFALAAFALRAVTPAGYMLGTDPETGEAGVYLCQQDGGSPPADWENPFEPEPHHSDQDEPNPECPFAIAGTSLTPDAPTIAAIGQHYSAVVVGQIDTIAPRPATYNPTARPRAPPSLSV